MILLIVQVIWIIFNDCGYLDVKGTFWWPCFLLQWILNTTFEVLLSMEMTSFSKSFAFFCFECLLEVCRRQRCKFTISQNWKKKPFVMTQKMNSMLFYSRTMGSFQPLRWGLLWVGGLFFPPYYYLKFYGPHIKTL